MAAHCVCPLVTSARFAEWSGRRREGDRDDGQPVERSKPRVGHGVNGNYAVAGSHVNISKQTKVLTPASPFMNMIYAITGTSWITEQRHSKRN
jgi:hypothetical protein